MSSSSSGQYIMASGIGNKRAGSGVWCVSVFSGLFLVACAWLEIFFLEGIALLLARLLLG